MKEVNSSIANIAIDTFVRAGLDVKPLLAGLPIKMNGRGRVTERVDWDPYLDFVERAMEALGGPEKMVEAFSRIQTVMPEMQAAASLFVDPADFARLMADRIDPTFYPHLKFEWTTSPDRTGIFVLTIPPPYRGSVAFMYGGVGSMLGFPQFFGQPVARAKWQVTPRRMEMFVELPPSRTLPARLKSASKAFFSLGLERQFVQHHEEIQLAHEDLKQAHARITAQADRLRRLNVLGHELTRITGLGDLAEALTSVLSDDLATRSASLWLADATGELACFKRYGLDDDSRPVTSHSLQTGGRTVGRRDVVLSKDAERSQSAELLSELLPWISLAIENALHVTQLVEERRRADREIEARKRSEAAMLAATEAVSGAVFMLDPAGRVEAVNASGRQALETEPNIAQMIKQGIATPNRDYEVIELPGVVLAGHRFVVRRDASRETARRLAHSAEEWALTARQQQVLARLVRGLANKEIAADLDCADNTVEFHVTQLLRKARVDGRAMLVAAFWARP